MKCIILGNASMVVVPLLSFGVLVVLDFAESQPYTTRPPLRCYDCKTFDGINDPTCLHPVTRKGRESPCSGNPKPDGVRCMKFFANIIGLKGGEELKTTILDRRCFNPPDDLVEITPECGKCYRYAAALRTHPAEDMRYLSGFSHPQFPDDLIYENRTLCACCTDLCNAEEGIQIPDQRKEFIIVGARDPISRRAQTIANVGTPSRESFLVHILVIKLLSTLRSTAGWQIISAAGLPLGDYL